MSKLESSIELFNYLAKKCCEENCALAKGELEQLLGLMKQELFVSGCSSLMNAIGSASPLFLLGANPKYKPTCFYLSEPDKDVDNSSFDVWGLVTLFAQYMRDDSIVEDIDTLLPNIFVKKNAPEETKEDELLHALESIDGELRSQREKMYKLCFSASGNVSEAMVSNEVNSEADIKDSDMSPRKSSDIDSEGAPIISAPNRLEIEQSADVNGEDGPQPADDNAEDEQGQVIIDDAEKEGQIIIDAAVKEGQVIINDAENQGQTIIDAAENQGQAIIDAARKEADRIIQHAIIEAENKISNANKRLAQSVGKEWVDIYAEGQKQLQQSFLELKESLRLANEKIRIMENSISEDTISKITAQFLELFNLIADSKESAFALAYQKNDPDLENAAYNLDAFGDMIVEYLADYGIQPLASALGDPFSAKHHEIINGKQQFDPRNVVVKASKRRGFIWGEVVLQKERVEI